MSSDKQTLILAGEAVPPSRGDAGRFATGSQLQRVTMLLVQGEYAASPRTLVSDSIAATFSPAAESQSVLLPPAAVEASAVPAQFAVPNVVSNRALSGGAVEYARTQNLSGGRTRTQIIDTYA